MPRDLQSRDRDSQTKRRKRDRKEKKRRRREAEGVDEVYNFVVNEILESRFKHGRKEYYVSWLGYPDPKDNTWEPRESFKDPRLIDIWELQQRGSALASSASSAASTAASSVASPAASPAQPEEVDDASSEPSATESPTELIPLLSASIPPQNSIPMESPPEKIQIKSSTTTSKLSEQDLRGFEALKRLEEEMLEFTSKGEFNINHPEDEDLIHLAMPPDVGDDHLVPLGETDVQLDEESSGSSRTIDDDCAGENEVEPCVPSGEMSTNIVDQPSGPSICSPPDPPSSSLSSSSSLRSSSSDSSGDSD